MSDRRKCDSSTEKSCSGISTPTIIETNLNNGTEEVELISQVTLTCEAAGEPPPEISWYKDGSLIIHQADRLTIRQNFHTDFK